MAEYIPHDDPRRAKNLKDFHGKTPKEIKETRWYHGTNQDFSKFRQGRAGAIYISPDPDFASFFASEENREGGASNVMPVHIRAQKPFDYENKKHIAALYENLGPDLIFDPLLAHSIDQVREGHWEAIEDPKVQKAIKAMGHDSFYVRERGDDDVPVKNLAVYSPEQIKSATGNQGTFDPTNPDITKADGGEIDDQPSSVVDLGQARDAKRLNDFHSNLMGQVRDTAREMGELIADHRESGNLPFDIGTRFTTEHSRENNLPPFKVTGYFVNRKNPDEHYGYHVERQMSADPEDVEKTTVAVRHPRLEKLHGPEKWAELTAGFRPFTGLSVAKADGGALSMLDEERDPVDGGIIAYHGSPHDFEQFDVSKIGTGEGAQAYGHGLYFAENEGVAKGYRDDLSKSSNEGAARRLKRAEGDIDAAIAQAQERAQAYRTNGASHYAEAVEDDLRALERYKKTGDWSPGHMYEVHINAHPDHLLDWDAPFEKQPEYIKSRLDEAVQSKGMNFFTTNPGHLIYEMLNEELGAKDTAKHLLDHGIKGIKYLDAVSRGDNEAPTHNYVVFDHDHVRVRRKYKQGGAV